jgi:leucyl aminopeptidase
MAATETGPAPTLTLKSGNPLTASADAVVVGCWAGKTLRVAAPGAPAATLRRIERALTALGASAAADEVVRLPGTGISTAPVIVAVGLGPATTAMTPERLRRAAGAAVRNLAGYRRVALALPHDLDTELAAVLEGAALGSYAFTRHLHSKLAKSKTPVRAVSVFTAAPRRPEARDIVERALAIGHNVNFARDLINTSPLQMAPADVAARARQHLAGTAVKVTVLDDKALRAEGYGGIIGVGQGSSRPPRLVRMEYRPRGAKRHVALIGKGITFDTGGISLKPPAGMHAMKADMSGAAAVIATMRAVADLSIPVSVTGYAACAENMPGGSAQRPGDVITIFGGKTVEVLNTDAEGRLVMADVLVRAGQDRPNVVLDISTLTGACVVALGHRTAAVLGDPGARDAVKAAADRAGEEFWPMPMPEELRPALDSTVADIANIGSREGGTLSAAHFLKEFVPAGLPWAHMDIAGPAFHEQAPFGYTHKGGVGFGVRTMLAFIEDLRDGVITL